MAKEKSYILIDVHGGLTVDEVWPFEFEIGAYAFWDILLRLDKDPEQEARRLAFKKQYRKEHPNEEKMEMEQAEVRPEYA